MDISPKQNPVDSCSKPQKDSRVTILESDFVVLSFGLGVFKVCCPAAVSPSSLGASTGHPRSISTFNASRLKQGDSTACVARGNSRKTQGLVHKSYSYLKYICIVISWPHRRRGGARQRIHYTIYRYLCKYICMYILYIHVLNTCRYR